VGLFKYNIWGYDKEGYNRKGYNKYGYNRNGFDKNGYDINGYNEYGYNREGFNKNGFNVNGYDCDGYDSNGYNEDGYGRDGYNVSGYDINGLDRKGFDSEGYNASGYNCNGFDRNGYDEAGYDKYGFDKEGYDKDGYNRNGFDKNGYDINGYNEYGYNREGFNKNGFNVNGYDCDGYDSNGYNEDGYGRDGYNAAGYDKYGYDKEGYNKAGYDIEGYDQLGYNIHGYDRRGLDKSGYDKEGYDLAGYNQQGYDKKGYDKNGYNEHGYNKYGLDVQGKRQYDFKYGQALYHETFGKGKFIEYTSINHFKVSFLDGDHIFVYPDAIGVYIFIYDDATIENKELQKTSNIKKEDDLYERNHFKNICDELDIVLHEAREKSELTKYAFNDWSDSYDARAFSNYSSAAMDLDSISKIRNNPYFSKIVSQKTGEIYIGKNEIPGRVIDWADPICSLYYEYQMYIGNEEYLLSLVRNFDISMGKYYGFTDVYSENDSSTIYSDELLLKIIEANRENLQVHDIIATIQKDQYKIISQNSSKNIMVLGCAGSGKTMIMLHRLKYLIRNYKLEPKKTVVISPTGLLNIESNDLVSVLQLEQVNKYSTKKMNYNIVAQYAKRENLYLSIPVNGYISNNMLWDKFIFEQYNSEFIDNSYLKPFEIITNIDSAERKRFIIEEKARILEKGKELFGYDLNSIEEYYSNFDLKFAKEFDRFLRGYSNENIIKMISVLQYSLQKVTGKEKDKNRYNLAVLKNILNNNLAKGTTAYYEKKDKNGNVSKLGVKDNPSFANYAYKFYKEIGWEEEPSEQSKATNFQPYEYCQKIINLHNRNERFSKFISGSNMEYYFDIIQYLIDDIKIKNEVSLKRQYEYELFIFVYICSKCLNPLSNTDIVFIDEFQDYSKTELEMYARIYPTATFNLYGDYLQCINIKGIKNESSLIDFSKDYYIYNIQVNYRNSLEITEFVNKTLNTNMTPVGISGMVKKIAFEDIDFKNISCKSTAFILSDENPLISVIADENTNVKSICDSEEELATDKINLLPVSLSKGLEFETVYVFADNMSDNEKYVAFTRAWGTLYVIE